MRKRKVLLVGLSAGAALLLPVAGILLRSDAFEAQIFDPRTLRPLFDDATIIRFGVAYRLIVPQEDRQQTLLELVGAEHDYGTGRSSNKVSGTIDMVDRVKKDFKDNNIVTLDGWIISSTEARQCALTSILLGY